MTATHKVLDGVMVELTDAEIAERTQFIAENWNQAERNLEALRDVRNSKLSETDWWASSDLTMTEAQTAYRQALRDITDTYTSLDDVVWPEVPNE